MNEGRWTEEEKVFLYKNWGAQSIRYLSERLRRSECSIKQKAFRMGLGSATVAAKNLTLSQVSKEIGRSLETLHYWAERHGFPAYRKMIGRRSYWMVNPKAFWEWVREHPERITPGEIPRETICPEPDWVDEARRTVPIPKRKRYKTWTSRQETEIKRLAEAGMTRKEIGKRLGRTRLSVQRKFEEIGRREKAAKGPQKLPRGAAR